MISVKDAKAVENPISAMFDLADDVYDETPKLKKMVLYAILFIGIWLVINFILAFTVIFQNFLLGIALLVLLIIGSIALRMLFTTRDLFIYYEQRHRAIQSVRSANPETPIPQGKTPIDRALAYLKEKNSGVRNALRSDNASTGTTIKHTGGECSVDFYSLKRASLGWRLFGWGERGFVFYLKYYDGAPSVDDIKAFDSAIIANTKKTGTPPSRIVILASSAAEGKLSDDAYDYIIKHSIKTEYSMSVFHCTMQLIIESSDGTYDFIPFVVDS